MTKPANEQSISRRKRHHVNLSRTIPEVFDLVSQAETREDKINLLRLYDTKSLRFIVNGLYNVDWSDLKIPNYKPSNRPPEVADSNILKSIPRIEAAYQYRLRRPDVAERAILNVLESVSSREAELLVNMMAGRKIDGISKAVFKAAYPHFFRVETQEDEPSN